MLCEKSQFEKKAVLNAALESRRWLRMAWRPMRFLIEGVLDNTVRGKVTGWMRFVGLQGKVTFDLDGNFHRDIRGADRLVLFDPDGRGIKKMLRK